MATLNEITRGHSLRITRITKVRDDRLQEATMSRDRRLRALPAAAKLYEAFDDEVAEARGKQLATDSKAEAMRSGAVQEASIKLSDALQDAQRVRRDADTRAFEKKRQADLDTEHEFSLALAASPSKSSSEAQRIRADKLERAKKEFDEVIAKAQQDFRAATETALLGERRDSRDAARTFDTAVRVSEASVKAARSTAEQALARALAALPDGAAAFAEWRQETAAIAVDYRKAENEEFARFHLEVQKLKV